MLYKYPLPLAVTGILGDDDNTQEMPFGLSIAATVQNGSEGE